MSNFTFTVETKDYLLAFMADVPTTPDRLQVEAIIAQHQNEIVRHKNIQRLNPDWKRYRELVQQDRLFVIFARKGERIVGYIAILVARHLHDRELIYSMDDLYYVEANSRMAQVGSGMVEAAENEARRRGSKLQTMRAKIGTPAAQFLEMIGYHPFETVFAKVL